MVFAGKELEMKHLTIFLISLLLFCIQKQASGQDKVLKCTESNERCELPFTVSGKRYEACTTDIVKNGRAWCPTKIHGNGTLEPQYCMECWAGQRCYYTGEAFPDSSWILSCPPGCLYVQKSTFGTNNEFSSSSYVCAAAIHEGLASNEAGGVVVLEKKPWKKAFVGAEKNGVTTYNAKQENFPMMSLKASSLQIPDIVFAHDKTTLSFMASGSTTAKVLNDKQLFAYGMASDVRRNKIFWSDVTRRTISSATFSKGTLSNIKVIVQREKVLIPEYLTFDWMHGNLFWTDRGFHSVSVSGSNGQNILTLIKRGNDFIPKGIALDPQTGFFFITTSGPAAKIERCRMYEKDKCETIIQEDIQLPAGVAFDSSGKQVCWADSGLSQISCSKTDGSGRRKMEFSTNRLKQPFSVITYQGRIYWTDWLSTIMASADIETWKNFYVHLGDVVKGTGLTAFDNRAQPLYRNKCSGAPCQHLCVPTENGYMCLCSDGYFLHPDGSCQDSPRKERKLNIYVADFTNLKRVVVNLETSTSKTFTILRSLRKVAAVSVDTQNNVIYWAHAEAIEFAPISNDLAGNGGRTLLNKESGYVSQVEGIAVDSVTRLLYWTDIALRSVFVTNLNPVSGQHHIRVLVSGSKSYLPRGIALDPKEGHFYVVDAQNPFSIQRCESRGEPACNTLFGNGAVTGPQMLAIDFNDDVFFVTQKQPAAGILSINLLGRRVIPSNLINPYGIGLFEDRVYVTDINHRYIISMNKKTGKDKHIVAKSMTRPLGIFLHEENSKPADYVNVCFASNCRYLCVPTPVDGDGKRYTCLCPDRLKGISDAPECEAEQPSSTAAPPTPPKCELGYELDRNRRRCVDVEECLQRKHDCQQECRNTLGSFNCECRVGYQLQPDKKTCKPIQKPKAPCSDNPCQNGGTCQVEDFEEVCLCDEGFKGKHCEQVDARIVREDRDGGINLQCVCPKSVSSEIIWLLNRLHIDPSNDWSLIREKGRLLTMHRPYFDNSGNFTCQFRFNGFEYMAGLLVIIKASPHKACGRSPGPEDPDRKGKGQKILGGKQTQALQAPFVAMFYKTTEGRRIGKGAFCGGSIVDTRHIVTAAHCFKIVSLKEVMVYVGKLIADDGVFERFEQSSEIESITIHPDHDPDTLDADIAIVRLKTEIYYTKGVKPLCIPKPDNQDDALLPKAGKNRFGIVYGWGLTQNQDFSRKMLEISLPITKRSECRRHYPDEITTHMFCAGGKENKDTCQGDSGGPFTLWSKKKLKWYLGGIVSWGEKCGKADTPGVYVRIRKELRKWIYDNTDLWL